MNHRHNVIIVWELKLKKETKIKINNINKISNKLIPISFNTNPNRYIDTQSHKNQDAINTNSNNNKSKVKSIKKIKKEKRKMTQMMKKRRKKKKKIKIIINLKVI